MDKEKLFKTTDIALASTLMLYGFEFRGVEPMNQKKVGRSDIFYFVFVDQDQRKDIVMKYAAASDDIKVKPIEFRSTLRYLKEQARNFGAQQDQDADS